MTFAFKFRFRTVFDASAMVNPGAFRGSRKEFLLGEKAAYAAGMQGGYGADALAQIQRRFFKRYPVDLGPHEEPSQEHLDAVDDDAPEPENEEPDPSKLSAAEYEEAMKECDHRKAVIRFRKAVRCVIVLFAITF